MTSNPPSSTPVKRSRPSARIIVAAVLTVLAIVFFIENRQTVRIRLIVPVVSMPVWLALAAMFVIGGLCGLLVAHRHASK